MRKVTDIDGFVPVKTALVSVFNKDGLEELIPGLIEIVPDIRILSTGGTFKRLKKIVGPDDPHIESVSGYIGMEEADGGLVKTIDRKLGYGYLGETHCEEHQREMAAMGAADIDLLIWNLYPLADVIDPEKRVEMGLSAEFDYEDARMNKDVGGILANRACSKNWHRILSAVDPTDYQRVLAELRGNDGQSTSRTRWELMLKVLDMIADDTTTDRDYHRSLTYEEAMAPYIVHNPSDGGD